MQHASDLFHGWAGVIVSVLVSIPAWVPHVETGMRWISLLLAITAAVYTIAHKRMEIKAHRKKHEKDQ